MMSESIEDISQLRLKKLNRKFCYHYDVPNLDIKSH